MFADDTKIYGQPGLSLQNDLDKAVKWSTTWQMKFNPAKCTVLHMGRKTPQENYFMTNEDGNRVTVGKTSAEKDIGLTFDNDLKFQTHISNICKKANLTLGIIRRSFTFLDEQTFTLLYSTLVRPVLEYAQCVWSPWLKKHIIQLENVQRRATKLLPHLRQMTYRDRLVHLNLFSTMYRRKRGDLIQTYRLLNNLDNINASELFIIDLDSKTRGHKLKLQKQQNNKDCRKYHFTQRIINDWNRLPPYVVFAATLDQFKVNVDAFFGASKFDACPNSPT